MKRIQESLLHIAKRRRVLLVVLLAGAFLSVATLSIKAQQTIHVPADQPTIQAGINAAHDGDTVLVAPGTYNENIDFMQKSITVTSGATSSAGAAATIIKAPAPDPTVIFYAPDVSQNQVTAVLNGFTITHAPNLHTTSTLTGTGITVAFVSSATITNNLILDNPGCGLASYAPRSVNFQGNTVTSSSVGTCGIVGGTLFTTATGVIAAIQGSIHIVGNLIINNHASITANQGIVLRGAGGLLLKDNVITGNTGPGEPLNFEGSLDATLVQNLIYGNISSDPFAHGIEITESDGQPFSLTMTNNTIVAPSQTASAFFLSAYVGSQSISNNIFLGQGAGQAVSCYYIDPAFGSSQNVPPSIAVFSHNDVYQAGTAQSYQCASASNTLANLSADPEFLDLANGNLHTQRSSPVVAAGDINAPLIPPLDLDTRNRTVCGAIDLGVYEIHPRPAPDISSSLNPSIGGMPVLFTARVPGNCNVPTGTVTFLDGGSSINTATLDPGASASFSTAALVVGSHTITASYSGDTNFDPSLSAPYTQVVTGDPSATILAVAPNPAGAFTPIALASTVTSTHGKPTGTVRFTANGQTLATAPLDANGNAAATISTLGAGSYSIIATYTADVHFGASSSAPVLETVFGAESLLSLSASPDPSPLGQTVSFTAVVRGAKNSSIKDSVAAGMVAFADGSAVLGSVALDPGGRATFSTASLTLGTHTITASYGGSGNFNPSSASVQETITAPVASFTLTLAPSSTMLRAGQSVTVTLQLASIGVFSGPLTLTYGLLPPFASATLTPAIITLAPGGAANATLIFNTTSVPQSIAAAKLSPQNGLLPTALAATTLLLLPLGLLQLGRAQRMRLKQILSLAVAAILLGTLTGCVTLYYKLNLVAPGTYQIGVTATDDNQNSQTAHLAVTIVP